jgi:hypothetical protein
VDPVDPDPQHWFTCSNIRASSGVSGFSTSEKFSVANSDPGSGAFLTPNPGFGMGKK